jgi:outer membrane murein-binding lipoprotein Lpp
MLVRHILAGSVASVALFALTAGGANAQTGKVQQLENQIQNLQNSYQTQIQSLQSQIDQLKEQQQQQAAQAAAAQQQAAQAQAEYKKASSGLGGTYHIGGVTLKVGGFIESATIFRSSTQTSDVATGMNTAVPFGSSTQAHLSEFRESARQSRLSLLAYGQPDDVTNLSAYWEMDFLGMGSTANSNQSNSYNLRLRQAFAEYDRKDFGFSLVGGQAWSLATLYTSGLYPRNEAVPLTIDANYNVGFNWLRVPQMRFIENFAPGYWGAVSFESPQAVNINNSLPATAVPGVIATGDVITGLTGGSGGLLGGGGNTQTFSIDPLPDIIAKVAAEPGWGHFELYGIGREFRTDVNAPAPVFLRGHQTAVAGGIGAGAIMPVLPKLVDFEATMLWGDGIGKYGAAQLSDYTVNQNGQPSPNREVTGLIGLIGHPTPVMDLYGYWGIEHSFSNSFDNLAGTAHFGLGNAGYTNLYASCAFGALTSSGSTTGVAAPGCNIQQAWEAQVGGWWNFYKGTYGRMALGASYAYLQLNTFPGTTGTRVASNNIVMISFRYYPF